MSVLSKSVVSFIDVVSRRQSCCFFCFSNLDFFILVLAIFFETTVFAYSLSFPVPTFLPLAIPPRLKIDFFFFFSIDIIHLPAFCKPAVVADCAAAFVLNRAAAFRACAYQHDCRNVLVSVAVSFLAVCSMFFDSHCNCIST